MADDSSNTGDLIFRPMTHLDLDRVVDNEMRSYAFPWTEGVFSDCIGSGHECWVLATATDELIGHSVLSVGAGEAHLLNVCVRRDRQGEGHGRQLAIHMLDRAQARRAEVVYLEVRPSNRVALGLYGSLGFTQIGHRPGYYPAEFGFEDAQVLALRFDGGSPLRLT